MIKRVLITGATGFIGGRLYEVMSLTRTVEPRAFIHSTASASRISRFPIDFIIGDLCDKKSVDKAVRGCDAVVHLALGGKRTMRTGLENILRASVDHGVSRFVHMSSVAIYGNNPPPESVSEAAPAKRTDMEYGNEKLAQERLVLRYKGHGLPVVILRPPNVYGPFSAFTAGLINKIRSGTMAIVDGGVNPCNLVYVDNLVQAVLLALWRKEAVGETFFIANREVISWEQCLNDHAELLGLSLSRISSADLISEPHERVIRDSLRLLPRVLFSKEVRSSLRRIPLMKLILDVLNDGFQNLSIDTQQKIRVLINGPRRFPKNESSERGFFANDNIIAAQGRTVAHSIEKAQRLLGYTAPISYYEGMKLTEAWLRYSRII